MCCTTTSVYFQPVVAAVHMVQVGIAEPGGRPSGPLTLEDSDQRERLEISKRIALTEEFLVEVCGSNAQLHEVL